MYFDFEDYRPETPMMATAMSLREGILLSVVLHAIALVALVVVPELPMVKALSVRAAQAAEQRRLALERQRQSEPRRFVFVQPRLDMPAPRPPERAELSDRDRQAQSPQRSPRPQNPRPFSRGNTPELIERPGQVAPPREAQQMESPPGNTPENSASVPPGQSAPVITGEIARGTEAPPRGGGALGEALKNLGKYVPQTVYDNPQGGGGNFGSSIQFDTKGVEFGPWIRRFVAQIKRNWFIPYAAMAMKGHVVITFYVHKDGTISELAVVGPSEVESFNNAAFNALASSNPTQPLPTEYPSDKAFFTVTFYYNEQPPS
jgi:TonB family protein